MDDRVIQYGGELPKTVTPLFSTAWADSLSRKKMEYASDSKKPSRKANGVMERVSQAQQKLKYAKTISN